MPAKPSYSHRITEGVAAIEALETDWVDRRKVEEALGVSKTVAWRILKRCGAEPGPGNTLVCRRTDLISRLKELQTDGAVHEHEIRRRAKLEDFLERIRPSVVANLKKVVPSDQAAGLLSTTFGKLPPNVTLTPHSLHIEFLGTAEFLQSFGAVVYALHNDYEQIDQFLEDAQPKAPC